MHVRFQENLLLAQKLQGWVAETRTGHAEIIFYHTLGK
jgi:hypothetical protein